MEKVNIETRINGFKLRKEDKDKLVFLSKCIDEAKKTKENYNLAITIDNMPIQYINKYMNCIMKVLKENGITNVVNIDSTRDLRNCCKKIALINFDSDEMSYNLRNSFEDLVKVIGRIFSNNNILIMTSSSSLYGYQSINKSNILDVMPRISFEGYFNDVMEYKRLINRYKNNNINYSLTKEEFHEIYNSIFLDDYIQTFRIADYLYDYSTKNYSTKADVINIKTFDKLIIQEDEEKNRENKSVINLDNLIGLNNIKQELNNLFHYVSFLKENNISREGTYLNMFFLGNPGTGKTMVASIIANKLYELGFIKKMEVIKVIPTDLIGEYVGQTKRKIRDILEKAKGKILFIDEAYLLYNNNYKSGNNPFMQEAIIELLKYMEDVHNITIFAGYKEEMKKIYEANPGIKSRIYKELIFEDYDVQELYQILENTLKEKGFNVSNNLDKYYIQEYIKKVRNEKLFGNARSMKQLAQKLIINHANNYANKKTKEKLVITRMDIPVEQKNNVKEMGFGE